MRVCLYARYSTDQQSQNSITDQLRAGRERAAREGWAIAMVHADEGISGSTPVALRAGGKALLADALADRFDVLIVEGLDRITRDLAEQERAVKRLEHRGIRIIGTADGYDTQASGRKVMRIARGLVNELYLDDLRAKTHRGLQGQFERGFAAGGRTYGYASVQEEGGHRIVINEEQARHVRWIYEQVAAGATLRSIVYKLNERGVPSPRGNGWAASALVGNPKMGDGLLNNEIYIGRVVWNRRQWLKDPETGKRLAVARPPSEWMVREAPELRILDQALWDSTRPLALKRAPGRGRPHATLFGGLLRCATCGGAITAISSVRYGCSAHKDKGPTACPNSATWRREDVDHRLLAELREDLLSPAAMAEVQTTVRRLMADLDGGHERAQADARRRGAELDKEIKRIVDAIVAVGASEALATRLRAAELERKTLEATLQQTPQVTISADQIAAAYRRLVMNLRESLAGTVAEARPVVAGLLGEIILCRNEETGESWAQMKEPAEQLLFAAAGGSLKMVARGGFEPPTFGL
ncbi:MAG: recombinase family protein [Pseudacidovorax sp.]|uniref:recombinase family protein n=1 Tax=Pseudacidovorax sp. TaxID=1934311 RepID=UPI001B5D4A8B|nr:recombinase family protein [Pseudacidovorax sp.]MBP6894296.1 recombinase family protein [Pseudacidovorax sp.]